MHKITQTMNMNLLAGVRSVLPSFNETHMMAILLNLNLDHQGRASDLLAGLIRRYFSLEFLWDEHDGNTIGLK
jgi:hypothetical protein